MTVVRKIGVSNDTITVLAECALASQDVEFRAHVQLLLGRWNAEDEHVRALENSTIREKVAA